MYTNNMEALQRSGTTYSILVTNQTPLYEVPCSTRAGCGEQDHRVPRQDSRSASGHVHQIIARIIALPEVRGHAGQDTQLRFLNQSTRSSPFAASLVLRGARLLF